MIPPAYDLRRCHWSEVERLCEKYHPYKSANAGAVYSFGVFEDGRIVAGYLWQPPTRGGATSTCPEAPHGVLSLSRMVAVPKAERTLNHVSKPLRRQMKLLIDRGRWPVLVTYSDEGQGHKGHAYKCSGWTPTTRSKAPTYTDDDGRRTSLYSNGDKKERGLTRGPDTTIQRWEHWICDRGDAAEYMKERGWRRERRPGVTWWSGNPAYRYTQQQDLFAE